jgi:hypothetical protein
VTGPRWCVAGMVMLGPALGPGNRDFDVGRGFVPDVSDKVAQARALQTYGFPNPMITVCRVAGPAPRRGAPGGEPASHRHSMLARCTLGRHGSLEKASRSARGGGPGLAPDEVLEPDGDAEVEVEVDGRVGDADQGVHAGHG